MARTKPSMMALESLSDKEALARWEALHTALAKRSLEPPTLQKWTLFVGVFGVMATIACLIQVGTTFTTGLAFCITSVAVFFARKFEAETRAIMAERDALQSECIRRGLL